MWSQRRSSIGEPALDLVVEVVHVAAHTSSHCRADQQRSASCSDTTDAPAYEAQFPHRLYCRPMPSGRPSCTWGTTVDESNRDGSGAPPRVRGTRISDRSSTTKCGSPRVRGEHPLMTRHDICLNPVVLSVRTQQPVEDEPLRTPKDPDHPSRRSFRLTAAMASPTTSSTTSTIPASTASAGPSSSGLSR